MERMSLEFDGKVAVLKFNHPEVLNAIGAQMLGDFNEALQTLKDPANGARCLLLTGEGRGFSAGANLQDDAGSERRGNSGDGLRSTYHPILLTLRDLEMPIVTAVNGAAAGVILFDAGKPVVVKGLGDRAPTKRRLIGSRTECADDDGFTGVEEYDAGGRNVTF